MNQRGQWAAPRQSSQGSPSRLSRPFGAEHAVVVQRLHDRHAGFAAGEIGGWRDLRKRIVEVRDVRARVGDAAGAAPRSDAERPRIGKRTRRARRARPSGRSSLWRVKGTTSTPAAVEQLHLAAHDFVFARGCRRSIEVVSQQDAHRRKRCARACHTDVGMRVMRTKCRGCRKTIRTTRLESVWIACIANHCSAFTSGVRASIPWSTPRWRRSRAASPGGPTCLPARIHIH